jgi:predicted nucleic acid-binding protein
MAFSTDRDSARLIRQFRLCLSGIATLRSTQMQIGGYARREWLIVVTNNLREFTRMPGVRVENWA